MMEREKTQDCRKSELIRFYAQGAGFYPLNCLSWYPDLVNKLGRRRFLKKQKAKIKPYAT